MLRVQADAPFTLHWTMDEWRHAEDARSTSSGLGFEFADLAVPAGQRAPVHFTFYWPAARRWEGRDFTVAAAGVAALLCLAVATSPHAIPLLAERPWGPSRGAERRPP